MPGVGRTELGYSMIDSPWWTQEGLMEKITKLSIEKVGGLRELQVAKVEKNRVTGDKCKSSEI